MNTILLSVTIGKKVATVGITWNVNLTVNYGCNTSTFLKEKWPTTICGQIINPSAALIENFHLLGCMIIANPKPFQGAKYVNFYNPFSFFC